jgi:2-haloacid dehalogenase
MAVRALVFDVFGTLVDWRSGVAEAFRASGMADDPEELADDWRARYRPILAELNDGSRPCAWHRLDPWPDVRAGLEAYQTAARLLGMEAADVMLVAAHPWDLDGARNASLRTAFVDRPLEYGPRSDTRSDPAADESVADLIELAGRLAG